METSGTNSKRLETRQSGIKTSLKIILAGALLLATTSATAGLLSSPMGVVYTNPGLVPVDTQQLGEARVQVRTDGLTGELSLDASDVPPEFDPPASGCKRFPFDQRLELIINLSLGLVEGQAHGSIATENGSLGYRAELRGSATCVPDGGVDCGQVIVDLEARGVVADVSDPVRIGLIRLVTLGSLLRGPDGAHWASLSSNARLAGDENLIGSLTSMEEGESCGH